MLNIRIAKEKDKEQGYWLSLPDTDEERLNVLRKLSKGEPVGTMVNLCITGVDSSIPNLKKYIHEHDPIDQLSILSARLEKMTATDADIFSGALDMESVNGLEDVMRIANSLQDYELLPDISTTKELGIYLVESGEVDIPKSAWPYLDYERVGLEYESNNAGTYTKLGYVVKSGNGPIQTMREENETMRIFFPLKIVSYPQYDCSEDEREDISPREAVAYEDQILAAIAKENRHFENDRGLAEYIHDEALKEKVYSLYPSVEIVDGELWGVMTAGLKEPLSGEETAELLSFVEGQNSDGYGEGFEQRPIKTPDGEIYVSFWDSGKYSMKLEQEMKNNSPDTGYGGPVMGGM